MISVAPPSPHPAIYWLALAGLPFFFFLCLFAAMPSTRSNKTRCDHLTVLNRNLRNPPAQGLRRDKSCAIWRIFQIFRTSGSAASFGDALQCFQPVVMAEVN